MATVGAIGNRNFAEAGAVPSKFPEEENLRKFRMAILGRLR